MSENLPTFNIDVKELQSYRIKVLLVDDQAMIAEAVRRALTEETDIDFHYCQDPTEAIKMANTLSPTIILQDLVMPDIDGLMMVRFFRANKQTAQVPIIVLSTKEEPEIKSKAFAQGANDYLVKLPDRIELIARIRYHSQSFIYQKQRDEAFQALQESQRRLAEANMELQRLSSLDGLTGIPNRRRFDEYLAHEWKMAIRHNTAISLIMMDIDFFKMYNDHYGHQGGDDCLKTVAKILEQSVLRETDIVARYGGEEFAAILPDSGRKAAHEIAEAMRSCIQERQIPHEKSQVSKFVSISIGIATAMPVRGADAEALIAAADQALYKAKEMGRNQIQTAESYVE